MYRRNESELDRISGLPFLLKIVYVDFFLTLKICFLNWSFILKQETALKLKKKKTENTNSSKTGSEFRGIASTSSSARHSKNLNNLHWFLYSVTQIVTVSPAYQEEGRCLFISAQINVESGNKLTLLVTKLCQLQTHSSVSSLATSQVLIYMMSNGQNISLAKNHSLYGWVSSD